MPLLLASGVRVPTPLLMQPTQPKHDPSPPKATGSPIDFPEELPITAKVADIARAIHEHQVVVVAGETGSGKTTQLPKICLAMGRGLEGRIGVTQPRRIAATSVAARVAEELKCELGSEVGYQIRFANRTSRNTYVKFMTDGILLAEIQGDPKLLQYDTIILDEAHERTLNIDFLLGYLKRLLPSRPDFRLVLSSATLETSRFSAFFGGAPVIEVSGRTYPVETIHRPPSDTEEGLADTIAAVVEEITTLDPREDILVFLPGEREIHDAMRTLEEHALPHTILLPLYGRLSQADQKKVFAPSSQRRIVLSTNVAETSLTIPGIVYVIDTGTARINRYQPRSGVTQLLVEPVSQASAEQRKGRAGRTRSGVCFRLYEEADFKLRSAFTDPEVLRVGLSGAILQMKSLGIGELRDFPFVDPPPKRAVDEGYRVLEELGALDEANQLTEIGKKLARLPLDPRVARMVLGGEVEGALTEILVIASALGLADPRERSLSNPAAADQAHRQFRDERSDFLSLLRLWRVFHADTAGKTQSQVRNYCVRNHLSFMRMREWSDVHEQLRGVVSDMKLKLNSRPADEAAIHRAILPGLLSRIGLWNQENRAYSGARQTRFVLHPGSGLARKPPTWVVVAELVETSQLFGRVAAAIDPESLPAIAGSLCRRSHGDPYFAERTGEVMAKEEVTLYGLPIVRGDRVRIASLYPKVARRVFIMDGLVREQYEPVPLPQFIISNRQIMEHVKELRARARMSDMMVDEDALFSFFDKRVPDDVTSGKTFDAWRAGAETTSPKLLHLSLEDVLLGDATALSKERYPEQLRVGAIALPVSYLFDPSAEEDGATCTVATVLLPQLDPAIFDWTIPGWHEEKVAQLLFGLPKSLQRTLGVDRSLVALVAEGLRPFQGSLVITLCKALHDLTGVRVNESSFDVEALPAYLRFNFRIVDESGHALAQGRDLADLRSRFSSRGRETFGTIAKGSFERIGLVTFPASGLPLSVPIAWKGGKVEAFPALVAGSRSVDLLLLSSKEDADRATIEGVIELLLLELRTNLEGLAKEVPARIAASSLSDGKANPRAVIVKRVLRELVFEDGALPRSTAEFSRLVERTKLTLSARLSRLATLVLALVEPADKIRATLKASVGRPGFPREALADIEQQLKHLVALERVALEPYSRIATLPRYLGGILIRLSRLPNGPLKDRDKALGVVPYATSFWSKREALLKRGVDAAELEQFYWLTEELRLAVFAPELGPTVPVSEKRVKETWAWLTRP